MKTGRESQVAVLAQGIQLLDESNQAVIAWDALVEVAFEWDENPWGDPQFGRYNDMDWVLKLASARNYRIADSEVHRHVLQPAFAMHLPGYVAIPDGFDMTFEEGSGSLSCWVKAV